MARQAAVRPASPPVSHHAACTRLCYTPATQRPMLCFGRMSSPFALSVNSSSWAEWTEALTASQHNKHTHPRIHRLHSAPCLEMAPSHSIQYGNGHIVLQGPLRSLSRSLSCRRKELPLIHTGCSPLSPRAHCPVLTDWQARLLGAYKLEGSEYLGRLGMND